MPQSRSTPSFTVILTINSQSTCAPGHRSRAPRR